MSTIKVNKILSANNPNVDVADGLTITGEVKVASAVTSNSTGIDVTGIVTATSFKGSGANLTGIISGIEIKEEGSALSTQATTLNFVGSNITASGSGAEKTITVSDANVSALKNGSDIKIQANNSGATVTGVITAVGGNSDEGSFLKGTSVGIGTTTTTGRNAGVGTAAGELVFNTTLGVLQVYVGAPTNAWQDVSSAGGYTFEATGGTKNTSSRSGYAVHTFTSPGTFAVSGNPQSGGEILVVAGGGGAGCYGGGGGGAGGFRKITGLTFSSPVTVQVGSGGAGVPNPSGSTGTGVRGTSGTPSYFGPSYVSAGGGGGMGNNGGPTGSDSSNSGAPGGSGGGGGAFGPGGGSGNDPPVSPSQGNPGAGGGDAGGPRW